MTNKKRAFTLTELLIALAIVGAIAAMCIPSLMNKINNNILCTQLKSIVGALSELASDQLIIKKTKTLIDTDFANPGTLLSSSNFAYSALCTNAGTDCWKTSATGKEKVTYRQIGTKGNTTINAPSYTSIILKNGAILSYTVSSGDYGTEDKLMGQFCTDVNGNEPPNMVGRDYFCFYVTQKGKVVPLNTPEIPALSSLNSTCKSGNANYCTASVMQTGWRMQY